MHTPPTPPHAVLPPPHNTLLSAGCPALLTQVKSSNAAPAPAPAPAPKIREAVPADQMEALQATLTKAKQSQAAYSTFSQEQVDAIFRYV